MANFNVRVPDEMAVRFDAWAAAEGGRSPALRHLIDRASMSGTGRIATPGRLPKRPEKLTVRLTATDARGLDEAAAEMGLTPNAWVAALVRRRLHGQPTFRHPEEVAVLAMQADLRRIGVNVNQIARALNTAVLEGRVLDLEIAYLDDLRTELLVHMSALREAFAGNLAYWQTDP